MDGAEWVSVPSSLPVAGVVQSLPKLHNENRDVNFLLPQKNLPN